MIVAGGASCKASGRCPQIRGAAPGAGVQSPPQLYRVADRSAAAVFEVNGNGIGDVVDDGDKMVVMMS